jgi:tetratricopeptide (TPR) repeat protein
MKDNILHNALRFAKKGNYGDAITILEREILRYRDSFRFYYILALSCLRTGDFGRAYTYFKSAHDIKNRDVNVLLGIAALNMKRGENARAVDLYLKVLDIEPANKCAKNALSILRKYGGSEDLHDWLETKKIHKLYPPFPREKLRPSQIITVAFGVLAAAALGTFIAGKLRIIDLVFFRQEERTGFAVSALSSSDKSKIVETGGAYHTILTEQDVLSAYENARTYFNEYKDNSARIEINRILLSNASEGIKNKAHVLLRYIDDVEVGFNTLTERFDYRDVEQESSLYNGCYVAWGGMAANVEQTDNETSFDLLIGYETRRELRGIVRVICPFAFNIDRERPLDVLGRVAAQDNGTFNLNAVSIHQQR